MTSRQGLMLALMMSLGTCVAAAPQGPETGAKAGLPTPAFLTVHKATQVEHFCRQTLARAANEVRRLERRRVDGQWLMALDHLNTVIEDGYGPVGFLSAVHPSKPVRDAAQACEQRWQEFTSTLGQNARLFTALGRAPTSDAIDEQFVRSARESFEDAGMALPPERRPAVKKLNDAIGELGLRFDKNIRDADLKVSFTEAEMSGVPADVWKSTKRDADGKLSLGVDNPIYLPVLQYADSAEARERMWRAKFDVGGDANLRIMAELASKRRELAGLFGLESYADYVLRRRMAQTATQANGFLDQVKTAVTEREFAEVEELRQAKAAHLGQPLDQVKLQRWDVMYYQERIKRDRFKVDDNAFRRYFPPQESLRFVMNLAERLFGIRYVPVKTATWHPEVQAYAVQDVSTGRALGSLYVDLYPREGKYNHAAVWPVRASAVNGRQDRASAAALVVNFDRKGLSLDELETLLHEFGHALHTNLSQTRYASQAGTSVLHDFVEAPSQMLEDWVYDPSVMATMRDVCAQCELVPETMLAQARKARDYGKGVLFARQHLYASFDLAVYGLQAREPAALWASMEGATPLGHVPGSRFVASFSHIATGYAAGYYGYLWSLVVATDLRTAFTTDKLDARIGRRYRDAVLAQGAQRPPGVLVRDFLGRETSPKAFFEELKR